jgi:uncharacterized protein YndB with AHSA1/START domain
VSAIEVDSFLPHPPAKVWRALTETDVMAAWLMPNDFAPEVGHRFTMTTDPVPSQGFDGVIRCEVLALEREHRLKISWVSSGLDSTVEWRIEAEGRGTRLFLTHDGFDESQPGQAATYRILDGGWRAMMVKRLEEALAAMPG